MKVGLILSFKGTNYGMMLQAFATQSYLDMNNAENEIITIKKESSVSDEFKNVIRHLSPAAMKASLRKRKRRKIVAQTPEISSAHKLRVKAGEMFVASHLHDIVVFSGYENAARAVKNKYACVMIGSDQQWSPACFYSELNTLMFVPNDVKKASYATSMGVSQIPNYTHKRLKQFISRMDYVSVREETGKQIITDVTKRSDVQVVPDPTFLLRREDWDKLILDSIPKEKRYIFCYFLGDSCETINIVNDFAQSVGIEVIAVRNIESYSKKKVDYGNATVVDGPSVDEFVNYIRHAFLVCTDSFHGTVFSIINNVDFVTFYRTSNKDKNSRNSRIDDLLGKFELSDRIYSDNSDIAQIVKDSIDYEKVNAILESLRSVGRNYLEKIIADIKVVKPQTNNVVSFTKSECCGCGICERKCPKRIIRLQNDEEGFVYPLIDRKDECVHCGICVNSCPAHNRAIAKPIKFDNPMYAYNTSEDECRESSSGGVAAGLYHYFVKNKFTVYGVSYSDDFKDALFLEDNSGDKILSFLGSKYIKANINGLYEKIQNKLQNGGKVFVIALPCEIAALKVYLGKDWDNLFTCELICHGPSTPFALRSYVDSLESKYGSKINSFSCRAKNPLWKPYYISARFDNQKVHNEIFADSSLGRAFQALKRPSCNECAFKDGSSCSDMIIGDYHGAKRETDEYNKYGVSICFPNTVKGQEMIDILSKTGFKVGSANKTRAMANKALLSPLPKLKIRKRFSDILKRDGIVPAANDKIILLGLKKRKLSVKLSMYTKVVLRKIK